jgi:hypothetical protein
MRPLASLLAVAALTLPLINAAPMPATQPSDGKASPALALQRKLPEVKFTQVPLGDAIDYIQSTTGANIHVNWRALELLNVTRQMPVSVKLSDVTARRVLRSVLDDTGMGEQLTFYVDDGVLEVTTREIADSQLITRVYPVEDLVLTIPDFEGPTFNLHNQGTAVSGGGGGGGGGGSGILSGSTGAAGERQQQTKQQRAEDLLQTIQQTVHPEVWRDNGGTAAIRYFNGHLIVTAPRSIHEAISGRRM